MREILFRGKRIDNGEWEYGGCVFTENKVCLIYNQTHSIDLQGCTVEENSVGQYTGLTDKNGNKIFEGDIIEFPDHGNGGTKTGQIKYFDDETMFLIVYEENDCKPLGECFHGLQLEVIGNIHDNPELLEGES